MQGSSGPQQAISAETNVVLEEVGHWHNRSMDPLYALALLDALRWAISGEFPTKPCV